MSLRHKWVKDNTFPKDGFKAKHNCSVCGCERLTMYWGLGYIYSRGMINAVLANIECTDFNDRETLNRIDP